MRGASGFIAPLAMVKYSNFTARQWFYDLTVAYGSSEAGLHILVTW